MLSKSDKFSCAECKYYVQPVAVSIWFAISAFIATVLGLGLRDGEILNSMLLSAPLAAAVVAPTIWQVLVGKSHNFWLAGLGGIIISILSHPLAWYWLLLFHWFTAPLSDQAIDPLNALWAMFIYSFWSILLLGWITMPIGAIAGVLIWLLLTVRPFLIKFTRKLHDKSTG